MKSRYRVTLVAVLALLAASAVTAGAALAAPAWYSSATQPKAEWQASGTTLAESVPVKFKGKLTFIDESTGGATIGAECEVSGEGTAGSEGAGKISTMTFLSCSKLGGCESLKKIEAQHLPWSTELTLSKESALDVLGSSGAEMEIHFECPVSKVNAAPNCYGRPAVATRNDGGGVEATFAVENLTCTVGKVGKVKGYIDIEATRGSHLEANTVGGSFSALTSPLEPPTSGQLKIEDKGFNSMGISCSAKLGQSIESGGKGKISSLVMSSCAGVGSCESLRSATANHLPWKTELYESEGTLRDRIVSGGSGTPEYQFECKTASGSTTDACSLNVAPEVVNGLEGSVFAEFNSLTTKTTCSQDKHENEGVWEASLTIAPPAGVGALEVKK